MGMTRIPGFPRLISETLRLDITEENEIEAVTPPKEEEEEEEKGLK